MKDLRLQEELVASVLSLPASFQPFQSVTLTQWSVDQHAELSSEFSFCSDFSDRVSPCADILVKLLQAPSNKALEQHADAVLDAFVLWAQEGDSTFIKTHEVSKNLVPRFFCMNDF